jgi:formiminotetrahydrofolate cyclodeaminase
LETQGYLDMTIQSFLDGLAMRDRAPGGGSAAALAVAFAAGLVAMVARSSRDTWADAAGIAAQALVLQDRVAPLAEADARAWEEALAALEAAATGTEEGDPARRDRRLERRLERAATIPLEITEIGADVAELAVTVGMYGDSAYRADAVAAAALAAGGARAAAHLVEINLAVLPGDEQLARARASEQAAAEAAGRLLASIR